MPLKACSRYHSSIAADRDARIHCPDFWPPNNPDLYPVDYRGLYQVWGPDAEKCFPETLTHVRALLGQSSTKPLPVDGSIAIMRKDKGHY